MAKVYRVRRPNRRRLFVVLLAITLTALSLVLFNPQPAESHGSPIIDGFWTGDWCAPAFKGNFGPDTFTPLSMPACPLGDEFFWDDWDAGFYGAGLTDTMGWMLGGLPGAPIPFDRERFLPAPRSLRRLPPVPFFL